ncbi:MAG: pirin family protein [Candidatus Kapabacteria bacterium]|nr:pirin family protein [Candidatus Kapabacteria bacterium]
MANNTMIVDERSRDLGSFLVGRLLPFREKRQVGPFTFIDHMGPSAIGNGTYLDVDQHPHIGLSTLTYLFEGEVEHRDSTGAHHVITPGSVNFMTAGKGVTHTERTPAHLRNSETGQRIHGYQVWVALPADQEETEPAFQHLEATELPAWQHDDMHFILVAGEGYGRRSPLRVHSPLFMIDVDAPSGGMLRIRGELRGEIAIVVVRGGIIAHEDEINQGQMLISKTDDECDITCIEGTRLLLFGGEPFPEPRHLFWNFVSSRRERIEQAKDDWANRRFPVVEGDDTYIPLP